MTMPGDSWNRVDEFNDWEGQEEGEWGGRQPSEPRCKFCGSTDVRWRQQNGRWVLFSLKPGIVHACPNSGDSFDVVPE
jgi:hypothetical protein